MNIFRKYTWKVLGKNKTRTLVTIIGILLSAAMITAVTTSISSLQKFMLNLTVDQEGSWHGVYFNMQPADQEELKGLAEVENCVTVENIGYAQLENSKNEYKPYLFLGGMPENMTELIWTRYGFCRNVSLRSAKIRMPMTSSLRFATTFSA